MSVSVLSGGAARSLAEVVGDEATFRDWYERSLPRVYRFLLARTNGDVALAEELTQQTFVEAIRKRHTFDGRADAVTWLCAIGRNRLADHYRRTGRDQRRQLRLIGQSPAPELAWRASDTRLAVERALSELPDDQRLALVFRYLDDLPVREIATLLGRSESATESLLSRGRDAFRRAYGDRSDG